ncbi:MAG: hypothetical protein ACYDBH_02150 [Acidobacteriaceae bacterium]
MKKNKRVLLPVVLLSLVLAGCGANNGPYPNQTTAWFMKHKTQMTKQIDWCKREEFRLKEATRRGVAHYAQKKQLVKNCRPAITANVRTLLGGQ